MDHHRGASRDAVVEEGQEDDEFDMFSLGFDMQDQISLSFTMTPSMSQLGPSCVFAYHHVWHGEAKTIMCLCESARDFMCL